MDKEGIVVYVTSRCNNPCQHCVMSEWMTANPNYDMSMGRVRKLLDATKGFKRFYLTGGEPLLWSNLYGGIYEMVKEGKEVIITTSVKHEDIPPIVINLVAEIRTLPLQYKKHYAKPERDVPYSIPAECICGEISVFGDYAFTCHAFMNGNENRTLIKPGFTDKLTPNTFDFDACKRCVSNLKARVGKPIDLK